VSEVLVVDDAENCREPLVRLLRLMGYEVSSAASGLEALACVRQHRPDAILLDLMMPEMDGVSFLRVLRGSEAWRDVPVIVVSAISDGAMLHEASDLGITRMLLKSRFTGDDLLDCLREVCGSAA